jgi:nucleotide-binding universal stress UspA family protein
VSTGAKPRRILCAVATTADADCGISLCAPDRHLAEQVLALAGRVDARVRFVHAVDWLDERHEGSDIVQVVERELEDDWRDLDGAAEALRVPVDRELRRGKPWHVLLEAAREWDADLVAISPRRDDVSLAGRVLHGSTAKHILKDSPCPVWVVHPRTQEVRSILALVDRSDASAAVVETAGWLGDVFGASLHALCCLDYPADVALQRMRGAAEEIQRYHREVRQDAWSELERLTQGADAEWNLVLGEDWVVRQAPKLVADKQIDLVVMAGRSKPGLAGVLGSTAQKLLERVEASVWVVRP